MTPKTNSQTLLEAVGRRSNRWFGMSNHDFITFLFARPSMINDGTQNIRHCAMKIAVDRSWAAAATSRLQRMRPLKMSTHRFAHGGRHMYTQTTTSLYWSCEYDATSWPVKPISLNRSDGIDNLWSTQYAWCGMTEHFHTEATERY